MAYQAVRSNDRDEDVERSNANNTRNVRNAADVAMASGNPYAMAAGAAVKGLDKISGGRASEAIGKGMTTANRIAPGGRIVQNASNNLSESGASDVAGTAARVKNMSNGNSGGEQSSLPSSVEGKSGQGGNGEVRDSGSSGGRSSGLGGRSVSNDAGTDANSSSSDDEKKDGSMNGEVVIPKVAKFALFASVPVVIVIIVIFAAVAVLLGAISNFENAFGISDLLGEETFEVGFTSSSPEQSSFYERINNAKLTYQAQGKTVDPLKIVGVFQTLNTYNANIKYEDMNDSSISEIADAMFDSDNTYNEEIFKNNLINKIIPKYLKNTDSSKREQIAKEILDYSSEYYSLIGKDQTTTSNCSAINTCSYDIKGYSVSGKGNVSNNVQAKDIYVQLMNCNGSNPLSGETLVPFEKYVLGVLYLNNTSYNAESIKAQAVSLRSSLISSHVVSNSSSLTKDNNRWILKIPACNNYAFCNPDQGCSRDGSGQIHSGITSGTKLKDPLPEGSKIKTYVDTTAGEMLANSQGYVIYSNYKSSDPNSFDSTSQSGLDYKQILVQKYGQIGATNILKNSCTASQASCVSTGEFASWRQGDSAWGNVPMGSSGKTVRQIGCLVTSIAMLIVKSGVPTNVPNFNPGTFVEYLNSHGGFYSGGNLSWSGPTKAAPSFKYVGSVSLAGKSKEDKFNKIAQIVNQNGVYAVAEVKGDTGQHWVAIDSITGSTINMMDPSTNATDMWAQYNWQNTSRIVYFKVG